MPRTQLHIKEAASNSTAHSTVLELAAQLGRHLDSKEKLESALTVAIQTAFKQHNIAPFSRHPVQPVPPSGPSLPSEGPTIAVQNATPTGSFPKAGTTTSRQSQPRRGRLLSPSVARNRYRRMLQSAVIPDDTSVYSEFLTASDYDSEWDRKAAAIQSRARLVVGKTTLQPLSNHPRTKQRQEGSPPPPLPTPPQSDEIQQPLSSPIRPTALRKSPLKDPFVYHPPAFNQDDIYASTRPRSNSRSSTASSSSCSSTSTTPLPPTSSELSSIPDYQYIQSQERRRHRAHRAAKRGLPIPPPTPPHLPTPTFFPTSRGHTIPGRDINIKKRKAQDFLGNHGRLGPDKPPHVRKAMRINISETPVVDELWHPSAALAYAEKDQITIALTRAIELRAKLANTDAQTPWRSKFELVPPKTASKRIKKMRYYHDFNTQSIRGGGLRGKLASVFGINPYDPQKAREQLEKVLQPLVVANPGSFRQLEGCLSLKRWKEWKVAAL